MLLHQESFSILYFFFPDGNHDPRMHICSGKMSFAKILFLPSWFAKLLEANFLILPKLDGCVDLPNGWNCPGTTLHYLVSVLVW
jgi:hypothetical protein